MHVITKINGKDALPVRAIPLLTDWQGLSPDGLAKILAGDSDHWPSFDGLTAHRLHTDGSIEAIPPRWWRSWVVDKLQAISHTIKANQTSHETGRQQWRCASLAQLPAGVFVWRDEFETAHTMEYGPEGARARSNPQGFDPSVHILNFNLHPDPAIATLGMVLEGFNRTADGRPFDYPLKAVDAKRWERFGELSVEEAAFVVAGLEPPPISVIRYQPIPYQESPGATWARPNEYDDFVRAATSAIERGIISARSKIQDMHTVQLVELFDVLEWAEATGFTVALKLDGPRPARKSAPVQSVESDSTPAAEPVADRASTAALDGITTAQVAAIFDDMPYTAENWPRRLSGTKWLQPAQVALGAAGGATSLWCPATLARLVHARERGPARQKTLEALNRKFKSNPVLQPWLAAWNEYYDIFNDAD